MQIRVADLLHFDGWVRVWRYHNVVIGGIVARIRLSGSGHRIEINDESPSQIT